MIILWNHGFNIDEYEEAWRVVKKEMSDIIELNKFEVYGGL